MTGDFEIPNKLYFSIGAVCKLVKLEPYVLRFWEREFPSLSPAKGSNGRRMYRRKDVEMVMTIRSLLYEQGFTISGARRILFGKKGSFTQQIPAGKPSDENPIPRKTSTDGHPEPSETLRQLKNELRNILTILK
jgi:DNA-binding transcriptional MerR regulator